MTLDDPPVDPKRFDNTATATAEGDYGDICPPGTPPPPLETECTARLNLFCETCPRTKIRFDVWNENEIGLSGTERVPPPGCTTCSTP